MPQSLYHLLKLLTYLKFAGLTGPHSPRHDDSILSVPPFSYFSTLQLLHNRIKFPNLQYLATHSMFSVLVLLWYMALTCTSRHRRAVNNIDQREDIVKRAPETVIGT